MRILIVEDDDILADGLTVGLRLTGFTPDHVATIADARAAIETVDFDGIVLDIMLPDGLGLDLLEEIRSQGVRLPVLLLTSRDRVRDRVRGLDAGADDYLGKPFDLDELSARLRAMLRRRVGRASSILSYNGLSIDTSSLTGRYGDKPISFSKREFAILSALIEHPRHILSRDMLEEKLYGWQEDIESNAVEVHIHKLRTKIGRSYIETVRGLGYRLAEEETKPSPSD
ncbi:response regulator transcription factor [Roseibium aggregatum]|uniref:Response regulator transcription factor n=1 Tax=Roseibium aggregatum TaxID=187304 RepID=A0A939J3K8_9HYPH|nr:response regulator transcription factor [Roseibium aggregatum]MBN9670230.1 response regulator transcription factor [Roseibium aggregatum]